MRCTGLPLERANGFKEVLIFYYENHSKKQGIDECCSHNFYFILFGKT